MASTAVAPAAVGVQVGDFFVSSWGYDQTNIDFYKVVALTPKGIKVQEWTSEVVADNGPQVQVVPGDGPKTSYDYSATPEGADYWERKETRVEVPAPVQQKRLQSWGDGYVAFSVNSYSSASKWNGAPASKTGSGWGH